MTMIRTTNWTYDPFLHEVHASHSHKGKNARHGLDVGARSSSSRFFLGQGFPFGLGNGRAALDYECRRSSIGIVIEGIKRRHGRDAGFDGFNVFALVALRFGAVVKMKGKHGLKGHNFAVKCTIHQDGIDPFGARGGNFLGIHQVQSTEEKDEQIESREWVSLDCRCFPCHEPKPYQSIALYLL